MKILEVEYNCNYSAKSFLPKTDKYYAVTIFKSSSVHSYDGKAEVIEPNFVIISKGDSEQSIHAFGESLICDYIYYEISDTQNNIDMLGLPIGSPLKNLNTTALSQIIYKMKVELLEQSIHCEMILANYVQIFFAILSRLYREKDSQHKPHRLTPIRDAILNMPCNQWDVDQLIAQVGMSKRQFYYSYINAFKTTLKQDIINSRIDYAKHLLITTEYRVSEVAAICNYDNVEHFTRLFKKKTGITPRKFAIKFNIYAYQPKIYFEQPPEHNQ